MTVKCAKCQYWEEGTGYMGWCRRYPPGKTEAWPPSSPTDWCGEGKARKIPQRKKDSDGVNPAVKRVIDYYHDQFVERFQEAPVITGQKDGSAVKNYLKDHTEIKAMDLIDSFFENPPSLYAEKGLYGLAQIISAHNQVVVKKSRELAKDEQKDELEQLLLDEAHVWSNHPRFNAYCEYVKTLREPITFEEYAKEYM
jgi:hypothetical protein